MKQPYEYPDSSIEFEFWKEVDETLDQFGLIGKDHSLSDPDNLSAKEERIFRENFPSIFEVVANLLVNPLDRSNSDANIRFLEYISELRSELQREYEENFLEKTSELEEQGNLAGLRKMKSQLHDDLRIGKKKIETHPDNIDKAINVETIYEMVEDPNSWGGEREVAYDDVEKYGHKEIEYTIKDNYVLYDKPELFESVNNKIETAETIQQENEVPNSDSENDDSRVQLQWNGKKHELAEFIYGLKESGELKPKDGGDLQWKHLLPWFNAMIDGLTFSNVTDTIKTRCKRREMLDKDIDNGDKVFFLEQVVLPKLHKIWREEKERDKEENKKIREGKKKI